MSKPFKVTKFGAMLLGKERYEAQRQVILTKQNKYGPMVLGDRPPLPGTQTPDPNRKEIQPSRMSIAGIKEALGQNPHYATVFYEAELARNNGARLEVLYALRDAMPADFIQRDKVLRKIDMMTKKAEASGSDTVQDEELALARQRTEAQLAKLQKQRGAKPAPAPEPEATEEE